MFAHATSPLRQVPYTCYDATHAVKRRVTDVEPVVGVEQRAEGKVQQALHNHAVGGAMHGESKVSNVNMAGGGRECCYIRYYIIVPMTFACAQMTSKITMYMPTQILYFVFRYVQLASNAIRHVIQQALQCCSLAFLCPTDEKDNQILSNKKRKTLL